MRRTRHREAFHIRRRFLFLRLLTVFGLATVLMLAGGALAILALLDTRWLILPACLLPLLGWGLAVHAFRDIITPLTALIGTAEEVAGGDLSQRVQVEGRGGFGQLIDTFNHMIEQVERAEGQRRQMAADIAHELRTPLHIIQGNLEGVLDGVYRPTDDHIRLVLDETRLLNRLVDDLRTLAMAEARQLTLHKEAVQVGDLLADVQTTFGGTALAEKIILTLEISPAMAAATINVDVLRMNQVLGNLVTNALRHTSPGGRIILAAQRADGDMVLSVRDTGEGIPPDKLPHIFERFWRGDAARSRIDGVGGGLGLAIVQQLVRLHGGWVTVESRPGAGSTFHIHLPDGPG
jgi:two-component system OmpR family sensor kinase/two-component system sensor histidine kinase BaeS